MSDPLLLRRVVEEARAAWPGLGMTAEDFLARLTALLPTDADAVAIQQVHARDLFLAHACSTGDAAALRAFEATYGADIDAVLRGMGLAGDVIDEVRQELQSKLFVATDGPPKIAQYSGRAELRSWVRTATVRTALGLLRKGRDVPIEDELLQRIPSDDDDPELLHLKAKYRAELKEAFEEALAALSVRQRNTLRHHFVDGLAVDEIGAIYGVHKSTAFRWLEGARAALADKTRVAFTRRVQVDAAELQSILRLVRSQVELSVVRLLK